MNTGTYSDGSTVKVIGEREGFTYVTFLDGPSKGITTKVPSSWVTETAAAPAPARCTLHPAFEADYCPTCGTAAVIS